MSVSRLLMAKLGSNEATVTSASVRTAQSDGRIRSDGGQPGRSRVRCCSCAPTRGARPRPLPPAPPARQRRFRLRLARARRAERARRRAEDRPARGQGRRTAPSARPRRPPRLRHERCLRAYGVRLATPATSTSRTSTCRGRTLREAMRGGELRRRAGGGGGGADPRRARARARAAASSTATSSRRTCSSPRTTAISVRLLDFGLAQFDEAETLTAVGDVPGTLAYISPERLARRGRPAPRATSGPSASCSGRRSPATTRSGACRCRRWPGRSRPARRRCARARPTCRSRCSVAIVARARAATRPGGPPAAAAGKALRSAPSPARRRSTDVESVCHDTQSRPAPRSRWARRRRRARSARRRCRSIRPAGRLALAAATGSASRSGAPRAGLALALAAPVLPLGNVALGLAILYGVARARLAGAARGASRAAGSLFVAGPALAPSACSRSSRSSCSRMASATRQSGARRSPRSRSRRSSPGCADVALPFGAGSSHRAARPRGRRQRRRPPSRVLADAVPAGLARSRRSRSPRLPSRSPYARHAVAARGVSARRCSRPRSCRSGRSRAPGSCSRVLAHGSRRTGAASPSIRLAFRGA